MQPTIIDAHTHIHFPEFDKDRDDAIVRARQKGIGMITVGTDIVSTQQAIAVAQQHEWIWATAGIHPHEARAYASSATMRDDVAVLKQLASDPIVVGIGECGIDLFREEDREALAMQEELFVAQFALAHSLHKPIVVHSRGTQNGSLDGLTAIIDILRSHTALLHTENVCHFFTGDIATARAFLDLGFSFTFGGLVTFNRSFDDVVRFIPADRLLCETDAPFVAPASHRGDRNEPSFIDETIASLATIRHQSVESITPILLANTVRVFSLFD